MNSRVGQVFDGLLRLTSDARNAAGDDQELLERFVIQRDEQAFAGLVRRHGPMVMGVCRRVLVRFHDAEDACQATFLVLARRASAIRRRKSVASWLHGVAARVAWNMKKDEQRRQRDRVPRAGIANSASARDQLDFLAILDEELAQLPETNRQPLILCYLQGLTQQAAARQLGWPRGTLKRRLERGRKLLHHRLTRRGLALGAGGLATLQAGAGALQPISSQRTQGLAKSAGPFADGRIPPPALVPPRVIQMAEGVLRAMVTKPVKFIVLAAFGLALLCGGALLIAQAAIPEAPPEIPLPVALQPAPEGSKEKSPPKTDLDLLQGTWKVTALNSGGFQFPAADYQKIRIRFQEKTILWDNPGDVVESGFTLDPAKKPKQIDIGTKGPPGKPTADGLSGVGIYKLEGNKLTICLTVPNPAARPKDFKPRGQMTLYILERIPEKSPPKGKSGSSQKVSLAPPWNNAIRMEPLPRQAFARFKDQNRAV